MRRAYCICLTEVPPKILSAKIKDDDDDDDDMINAASSLTACDGDRAPSAVGSTTWWVLAVDETRSTWIVGSSTLVALTFDPWSSTSCVKSSADSCKGAG